MTTAKLRSLCRHLGSRTALGDLLGVSPDEIGRWLDGSAKPSPPQTRKVAALADLFAAVRGLDRPDDARRWLFRPSASLDGATPLDVAIVDGPTRVLDAMTHELGR